MTFLIRWTCPLYPQGRGKLLRAHNGPGSAGRSQFSSRILAFLAPNFVKAAVEGRLPRGIGIERLRDLPAEWSRQFEALGLNPE
jgi:hypothetical protein